MSDTAFAAAAAAVAAVASAIAAFLQWRTLKRQARIAEFDLRYQFYSELSDAMATFTQRNCDYEACAPHMIKVLRLASLLFGESIITTIKRFNSLLIDWSAWLREFPKTRPSPAQEAIELYESLKALVVKQTIVPPLD